MLHRDRAAKIISTLGSSSSSKGQIRELFRAGADVFRLNFSHGTHKEQAERYHFIRELELEVGTPIGVIMDLQGPKIRVQTFKNGSVKLERGSSFKLDSQSQIFWIYYEKKNKYAGNSIFLLFLRCWFFQLRISFKKCYYFS